MAGGEGFEPPLAESESAVLPLDEPPNFFLNTVFFIFRTPAGGVRVRSPTGARELCQYPAPGLSSHAWTWASFNP